MRLDRSVVVLASIIVLTLTLLPAKSARAQMVTTAKMPGFAETFGVLIDQKSYPFTAHLAESSIPGNILWPGDTITFSFQLVNNTAQPIDVHGKVDVVAFATRGRPGDVWVPDMFKIADAGSEPLDVKLPAKGFANFKISPQIPQRFGAYGLVIDLGPSGRQLLTSCVRTFAADPERVQYPRFCLDDFSVDALKRLGVKAVRHGVGYKPTTDKDFDAWYRKETAKLKELNDANIAVLFMAGGGVIDGPMQPLERHRPWLDDNAVMKPTKFDIAWLPSYDADFEKWIKLFASDFGWPRGPINAFSLWNEPWEGISISGWGADMPRYRDLYTRMASAVEAARKEAGAQVLVGGCDSTSNALDKLFGDGSDEFLSRFDFVSIHYQGMAPYSTIKKWVDRQSPNGRVRIWDTESWVANSDDRVAAVVAANRSAGYDRAMGIYAGDIGAVLDQTLIGDDGKTRRVQAPVAWSVAAAVGASQHFLGERPFRELLFRNGLPWVMVFDGEPDEQGKPKADDGVVVVVGDIGEAFGHDYTLYRTAHGIANVPLIAAAQQKLAALPADAPKKDREQAEAELQKALTLTGATLAMDAGSAKFGLYDFYGNPVAPQQNRIVIPLDSRGFFLRPDGSPGSFDVLLSAIRSAHIDGIEPICPVAHDLTQSLDKRPLLRLSLTNVLNRPIHGSLSLALGDLKLTPQSQEVDFQPNETREVQVAVEGAPVPSNTYPLKLTFDAGADGRTTHTEDLHCNVIARRSITVDGKLDDWTGVLPQTVTSGSATPTLTESAWFPFKKFDEAAKPGVATGYLAYDDRNFYFAAKVADDTPDEGMPRFENRDDDEYFYPETSYRIDPDKTLGHIEQVVADPSSDPRGLLKPGSKTGRIEAAWVPTVKAYALDLDLPQAQPHQAALYFLDPAESRNVSVEMIDRATGRTLDKRNVDHFHFGRYAVYNLAGSVRIRIYSNAYLAGGISGIFFDHADAPARPGAKAATAKFVKMDDDTQGNWQGVYGAEGCFVVGTPARYPGYVKVLVPDALDKETLRWPEGVRRYSYRKTPELPAGNAPHHDNVQIAFNVLPADQKPWYPSPPGTPPGYTNYKDTDYEYALNPVAAKYGGGTEIWRLDAPGMPHKHFFPRQGRSPLDGPVKDGKLVITRDGNTRLVECAIPWTEIPQVKARLDAGLTIKFSFRVNDNANPGCMELSRNRSVAKRNGSFHCDWVEHWANEVEFGFER